MFPASAGMNRTKLSWTGSLMHVPRERGDEPRRIGIKRLLHRCSPRARG